MRWAFIVAVPRHALLYDPLVMPLAPSTRPPDLQLDLLLYADDGQWAAHCLQLDLVEHGPTQQAAAAALLDVIRAHLEYALEHDNLEHLFHPASPDVWRRFLTAERTGSASITLAPLDDVLPFPPRVSIQEAAARPAA